MTHTPECLRIRSNMRPANARERYEAERYCHPDCRSLRIKAECEREVAALQQSRAAPDDKCGSPAIV